MFVFFLLRHAVDFSRAAAGHPTRKHTLGSQGEGESRQNLWRWGSLRTLLGLSPCYGTLPIAAPEFYKAKILRKVYGRQGLKLYLIAHYVRLRKIAIVYVREWKGDSEEMKINLPLHRSLL